MLKLLKGKFQRSTQIKGFTLLELLIAAFIGSFIIITMFTFLQGVLSRDQQESARANSQEEIQGALDFIADDLREAVYVYDATGLAAINTQLPHMQAPVENDRFPVLAFWKREFLERDEIVRRPSGVDRPVACLRYANSTPMAGCQGGDQYVFSLVTYYLRKDDSPTWSNSARIERWAIRGGVPFDVCYSGSAAGTCDSQPATATPGTPDSFLLVPDQGFQGFDLGEDVAESFNAWTKDGDYVRNYEVLVDFIDDTPHDQGIVSSLVQIGANVSGTPPTNPDCDRVTGPNSQRVPGDFTTLPAGVQFSSFYACVNSLGIQNAGSIVQVYLRGNALVRLNNFEEPTRRATATSSIPYLPTASVKSFVRGTVVPE